MDGLRPFGQTRRFVQKGERKKWEKEGNKEKGGKKEKENTPLKTHRAAMVFEEKTPLTVNRHNTVRFWGCAATSFTLVVVEDAKGGLKSTVFVDCTR